MTRCAGEVVRPLRHAGLGEILRRGDPDPPRLPHPPRHQRAVLQGADAQRDIDAILQQVDIAVRQGEFAGHVEMQGEEFAHQRPDMQPPEHHRRGHHQMPRRRAAFRRRAVLGLAQIGQDAPRAEQEPPARIGQRHPPGGPLQQPQPEPFLQRRDRARHRRGRQPQPPRRRGEALGIGHRDEGRHGIEAIGHCCILRSDPVPNDMIIPNVARCIFPAQDGSPAPHRRAPHVPHPHPGHHRRRPRSRPPAAERREGAARLGAEPVPRAGQQPGRPRRLSRPERRAGEGRARCRAPVNASRSPSPR